MLVMLMVMRSRRQTRESMIGMPMHIPKLTSTLVKHLQILTSTAVTPILIHGEMLKVTICGSTLDGKC